MKVLTTLRSAPVPDDLKQLLLSSFLLLYLPSFFFPFSCYFSVSVRIYIEGGFDIKNTSSSLRNVDLHVGNVVDNRIEGTGKMKAAVGWSYTGTWLNGVMHGSGRLEYAKGKMYEGDFVNGIRHGSGKYLDGSG